VTKSRIADNRERHSTNEADSRLLRSGVSIRPTELKNDAAPEARVPAETSTANHRGRYNNRYSWCYDNRCRGDDYDRTSIREAPPVRARMEATTTSARSAGTVNIGE